MGPSPGSLAQLYCGSPQKKALKLALKNKIAQDGSEAKSLQCLMIFMCILSWTCIIYLGSNTQKINWKPSLKRSRIIQYFKYNLWILTVYKTISKTFIFISVDIGRHGYFDTVMLNPVIPCKFSRYLKLKRYLTISFSLNWVHYRIPESGSICDRFIIRTDPKIINGTRQPKLAPSSWQGLINYRGINHFENMCPRDYDWQSLNIVDSS